MEIYDNLKSNKKYSPEMIIRKINQNRIGLFCHVFDKITNNKFAGNFSSLDYSGINWRIYDHYAKTQLELEEKEKE
jgi:hypothetical protein